LTLPLTDNEKRLVQETQLTLTNRWTFVHVIFPTLRTYAIPFDALNEGDPLEAIGFIFGTGKLEWLGYNLVEVA